MKTKCCVLLTLFLFSLKSFSQGTKFDKPYDEEAKKGRDPGAEVFIIKKDGEKITGSKLTYSKSQATTTPFGGINKKCWIAVDDVKVSCYDYKIIQTPEHYSVKLHDSKTFWRSGIRLRFGKINLYYYTHEPLGVKQDDVRGPYHVFVIEKEEGVFYELDYENFSKAIKDNREALAKLREFFPDGKIPVFAEKGKLEKVIAIVETYNQ